MTPPSRSRKLLARAGAAARRVETQTAAKTMARMADRVTLSSRGLAMSPGGRQHSVHRFDRSREVARGTPAAFTADTTKEHPTMKTIATLELTLVTGGTGSTHPTTSTGGISTSSSSSNDALLS